MKLIDLTHSFTNEMPVYPGDPLPSLAPVTTIEKDGYTDHELQTQMHVGTHMDAPLHMIPGGKYIDELNPNQFFGKGVLIDGREKSTINAAVFSGLTIEPGSIVLVYTGFGSKYRDKSYFDGQPTISEDFAYKAVELGVKIVGMDILGPDAPPFPTHKILLGNDILIIENLAHLDQLIGVAHFEVIALPMKLHADAALVRVVARILD